MATYSIVGAGESSSNPIHVFVGCDDATTEVCWTARISRLDNCNVEMYRDERICQTVSTYSSQISWTAPNDQVLTVYYEIHRPSYEECHPTPPGCEFRCTNLTAYAVPGSVEEGYTGDIMNILLNVMAQRLVLRKFHSLHSVLTAKHINTPILHLTLWFRASVVRM